MSKKVEELREQLEAARAELNELLTEQSRLGQDLRRAEQEDHEERLRTARSGGSITTTLSKMKSKVRGVKDRREELPYEIWAARVRVAELEIQYAAALIPVLGEKLQAFRAKAAEAEREMKEAEARYKEHTNAATIAMRDQTEASDMKRAAELEIERLSSAGPDTPAPGTTYTRGGA